MKMRHDSVGLRQQLQQQFELDRCQVDRNPRPLHRAPRCIHGNIRESNHGITPDGITTPQLSTHAGEEFSAAEWLHKVVVGAGIEGRDLVRLATTS